MKVDSTAVSGISMGSNDYAEQVPAPETLPNEPSAIQDVSSTPEPEFHRFPEGDDNPQQVSERAVKDAIDKANKISMAFDTRAEFSIHEVTKDVMVKIINTRTNEVIREFPPKKFLDLIGKLWDLAGIVIDERR